MNLLKHLRYTYIGLIFFILSLFDLPMFYLDLIVLDFIHFNIKSMQSIMENHPIILTASAALFLLICLIFHVIFRAKKGIELSILFGLMIFLFFTVCINTLVYEVYHLEYLNNTTGEGKSFSSHWHNYLLNSIKVSMWIFPLIGFILDKVHESLLKRNLK